ncbi:MAG: DUF2177 family protein [Atribacterota bacterium]|jgi:uncharacterized membrane protein|nr:DUF2177 family protein [Atribacterota bacterium]MDD3031163.1 DUF2177 family protein [Atribacterota bacterium]MDD3640596.1 DUF2177 family protein [Atribacterota bacterium]MDD4288547.1 DUF2177 family protein [Atribacterota bacterium]MDD4764562.1 DUF2177 family protein [Atribacterota bacterium]
MFIRLYLITVPVFFIIDMLWLGLVAKQFYQNQIGFLMKTNINWIAAIIFYFLFVAGIVFFVLMPSLERRDLLYLILTAAFYGLLTYATYDLTNLATLKDWSLIVTIVDIIWGMTLSVSVSLISYFISIKFIL